jgi:regulator of protease activity HflC (stomatin/prohibitin superfamily)
MTSYRTPVRAAGALVVLAILGIIIGLISASSVSTGPNEVALHIGGGPIENKSIKGCVPASEHQNFNSPGDSYVTYSTSQRDWDATGQGGSDSGSFKVVSKDNVEMEVPVIVRFYQITDCQTLEKFYDNLGQRYGAFIKDDGEGSSGWETMVRKIVADPVDVELGRIVQTHNWQDVRNDPKVRTEIANSLKDDITALVDSNAQGHYFDNFSVLVKKPEPTDPDLIKKINDAQARTYAAEAAKNTAAAQKAQADAERATAKAQAAKQVAVILGFKLPGMTNAQAMAAYNLNAAIKAGQNPYQPSGGALLNNNP